MEAGKYKDLAKHAYIILRQYAKSGKYTIASGTRQALGDMGINLKCAGVAANKGVKEGLSIRRMNSVQQPGG
jgi:hypothetical protein